MPGNTESGWIVPYPAGPGVGRRSAAASLASGVGRREKRMRLREGITRIPYKLERLQRVLGEHGEATGKRWPEDERPG